uniref:Uncharacterized protein n=1 Tax=Rhizophora mucronata TaxID=61149 RepID=A0A2P2NGA6_RHIMU
MCRDFNSRVLNDFIQKCCHQLRPFVLHQSCHHSQITSLQVGYSCFSHVPEQSESRLKILACHGCLY